MADAPRAGRPKHVADERIITATLQPPPKKYGVTHWSSCLLAGHLKIGNAGVPQGWIRPWRNGTFRFSTDPELVGKITDVVGLYLATPENAIMQCVDKRSQIHALDHSAPMLPPRIGCTEKRPHDRKRHGTATLFAAF